LLFKIIKKQWFNKILSKKDLWADIISKVYCLFAFL
jgi:hypothetical protein